MKCLQRGDLLLQNGAHQRVAQNVASPHPEPRVSAGGLGNERVKGGIESVMIIHRTAQRRQLVNHPRSAISPRRCANRGVLLPQCHGSDPLRGAHGAPQHVVLPPHRRIGESATVNTNNAAKVERKRRVIDPIDARSDGRRNPGCGSSMRVRGTRADRRHRTGHAATLTPASDNARSSQGDEC